MQLPQKFGNCPFICIFSWRERLVWLGYGCINTQGKNRISYSCRTVMIIPRSYLFNAALSSFLGERRASI
jgi:hypothetical protein